MTAHDEFQELLGAYALDAVDDDERRVLEEHLRGCAACREEVAEHREVAAAFTPAGEDVPDHLWGRVAAALHADEPAEGLAPVYPLAARPARRRWAVAALAGA